VEELNTLLCDQRFVTPIVWKSLVGAGLDGLLWKPLSIGA
jgi:hypothetical protein